MFLLAATITMSDQKAQWTEDLLTPYVYIAELPLLFATLTAHKPTHNDRTSLS